MNSSTSKSQNKNKGMPRPDISSYHPDKIDMKKCLSRRFGSEDRRWAPIIYSSRQCTSAPMKGRDLCPTCVGREAAHNPADKTNTRWIGRVTDPKSIPAHVHMPGSKWFEDKKPVWLGVERPVQKRTIVASNSSVAASVAAEEHPLLGGVKNGTLKLHDLSGQELRDIWCLLNGRPVGAPSSGSLQSKEALIEWIIPQIHGELKFLQGEFYWVVGSNAYFFHEMTESIGEFVGRVTADETIDADAVAAPAEVSVAVVAPVEAPVEVAVVAAPVKTPVEAPVETKRRKNIRSTVSRSTQEIRRLKAEVNKLRRIIRLRAERHTADIKMLRAIIRLLA